MAKHPQLCNVMVGLAPVTKQYRILYHGDGYMVQWPYIKTSRDGKAWAYTAQVDFTCHNINPKAVLCAETRKRMGYQTAMGQMRVLLQFLKLHGYENGTRIDSLVQLP
jgi:hypothetical protein